MSQWTYKRVRSLIRYRTSERVDLEFKAVLPRNRAEIARWMAAMANAGGGTIVYGIEEDAWGRAVRSGNPLVDLSRASHVVEEARASIDEPPEVRWTAIAETPDDGRGFLVVEVAPSDRVPHLVGGVAWGRAEHTVYRLKRSEIARLFARSRGFSEETGLATALRKPAQIVADIQRVGTDRVLLFRNIGERSAYGVRWQHLGSRDAGIRPLDDPFPVEQMRPLVTYTLRTVFPSASLPAKIRVSWRDDGGQPKENLVVVT